MCVAGVGGGIIFLNIFLLSSSYFLQRGEEYTHILSGPPSARLGKRHFIEMAFRWRTDDGVALQRGPDPCPIPIWIRAWNLIWVLTEYSRNEPVSRMMYSKDSTQDAHQHCLIRVLVSTAEKNAWPLVTHSFPIEDYDQTARMYLLRDTGSLKYRNPNLVSIDNKWSIHQSRNARKLRVYILNA